MKKQQIVALVLLLTIISTAIPLAQAANAPSKPNVTLPANWQLEDETAYPNAPSEYDLEGGGMVEYMDQVDYDFVMIYYENAPSITFTDADWKGEAEYIFMRDHENLTYSESGVQTIAGVKAGFAKGYEAEYDTYALETAFIKDGIYYNAYAYYDANSVDEAQVMSLLNSISTAGAFPWLYVIVGVVAAVAVVIVVVVVLMTRKKSSDMSQQPAQYSYAPPPPPPSA